MGKSQIAPRSVVCILGAGQLGKMSLMAAHQLGYATMVWAPDAKDGVMDPAMELATFRVRQPFNCTAALDEVRRHAAVVTTEWENVPLELIQALEAMNVIVRPGSSVLAIAQSRRSEKAMASRLNVPTTPWIFIPKGDIGTSVDADLFPGILKTDRLGYDGKGQWPVADRAELQAALTKANCDCILEKRVTLQTELSVLVARNANDTVSISDIVENTHRNGILDTSVWPVKHANVQSLQEEVNQIATTIAGHLKLEGVLVIEFFVDTAGKLYFNEMAPRPHNSFHGSIEAAYTSQFEQHIRAICNLPLGEVTFHTAGKMENLIGETCDGELARINLLLRPQSRLHLYGKDKSRPGRKMGHITTLY